MSSAVKKIASRWDAVSDENVAVLLRTQTLRIYIFVSSNYNIAYPIQRLQVFAVCPNPEGLHPCIKPSPFPAFASFCSMPKPGGFTYLYLTTSQSSTPAGSHITESTKLQRKSRFWVISNPEGLHPCIKPKHHHLSQRLQLFAVCPNPEGLHPCIRLLSRSPRPQRGRISQHQQNGKQKNEVVIVIPGCAFGLRDKRPNPKEINTLINETYLNDMATKAK